MEQTAKNVSSAGTAVALSSSTLQVRSAVIQAKTGNAGNVFIGSSGVDNSGDTGTALAAGEGYTLAQGGSHDLYNLATIFVDAENSGDGVTVTYFRA